MIGCDSMKVVISAGGTGGHIYPALAIINKIKKKNLIVNSYILVHIIGWKKILFLSTIYLFNQ